jgi:hypothetical protein
MIIMDATGVALIIPIIVLINARKKSTRYEITARITPSVTPDTRPIKIRYKDLATVFQKVKVFTSSKKAFAVLENVGKKAGLSIMVAAISQMRNNRQTESTATKPLKMGELVLLFIIEAFLGLIDIDSGVELFKS